MLKLIRYEENCFYFNTLNKSTPFTEAQFPEVREIFEDLLTTLEDAEDEVEDFTFAYYLEQYEDEE